MSFDDICGYHLEVRVVLFGICDMVVLCKEVRR